MSWDPFPTIELPLIDRFTMLLRHEKDLPELHEWTQIDNAETAEAAIEALRASKHPYKKMVQAALLDLINADRAYRACQILQGGSPAVMPYRAIPQPDSVLPPVISQMRLWRKELSAWSTTRVLEVLVHAPPAKLWRVRYAMWGGDSPEYLPAQWWADYDGWFVKLGVAEK